MVLHVPPPLPAVAASAPQRQLLPCPPYAVDELRVWIHVESFGPRCPATNAKACASFEEYSQSDQLKNITVTDRGDIWLRGAYHERCLKIHFILQSWPAGYNFQYGDPPLKTSDDPTVPPQVNQDNSIGDVAPESANSPHRSFAVLYQGKQSTHNDHYLDIYGYDSKTKGLYLLDPRVHDGGTPPKLFNFLAAVSFGLLGLLALVFGVGDLRTQVKGWRLRAAFWLGLLLALGWAAAGAALAAG